MNQKQSVPVKICAPDVKNSVLQQSRIVTRLNVCTAASGSMIYALSMVICAILMVSNLFEKTRKISEATHPPSVGHLNPPISQKMTFSRVKNNNVYVLK
jgi:hypothetical protein